MRNITQKITPVSQSINTFKSLRIPLIKEILSKFLKARLKFEDIKKLKKNISNDIKIFKKKLIYTARDKLLAKY